MSSISLPGENAPHLLCKRPAWGSKLPEGPQNAMLEVERWKDPSENIINHNLVKETLTPHRS